MERTVDNRRPVRPFACEHVICDSCDKELFVRADDRCPMCRALRSERSREGHMLSAESAFQRSQAMMQRVQNIPQPMSVFFASVPVAELTSTNRLLTVPRFDDTGDGGNSSHLLVVTSRSSIMQDPSIQHALRALTSVGSIADFLRAADTVRSTNVARDVNNEARAERNRVPVTILRYVDRT